jgi:hypothetical protein
MEDFTEDGMVDAGARRTGRRQPTGAQRLPQSRRRLGA